MPSERTVAEMVVYLGRAICCEVPGGLTPAQWTALRYFSRANRFSRTVSAFADFHLTTKGTASQTVKSLVGRGFLSRTQSDRDGRSVIMDLTSAGRAFLARDPLEALVDALARLPHQQRSDVAAGLARVIEDVAGGRGRRRFGVCKDCSFLHGACESGQHSTYTCRLVKEPLQSEETRQICVNFCPKLCEDGIDGGVSEADQVEAEL